MDSTQKLLPEKTIRKLDHNLKPFPCYNTKFEPKIRLSKNWKPAKPEIVRLKERLNKLSAAYDEAKMYGKTVDAKRLFKKAIQINKRIAILLGFDTNRDRVRGLANGKK